LIRRRRASLFPVNVWPPFVDALTLVLAGFVVLILVALLAQRGLLGRLRERDQELSRLRDDKARIERRLRALAPRGSIDIEEGKVILQGEVLFESGSDAVRTEGARLMTEIGKSLASLLAAEPGQMVLVGGHTDDRPIHDAHFASNWDLSTARAVAVTRVLMAAGLQQARVVAAGFGEFHPRAANTDEDGRRKNRRIEVLLVPITAVSSR
jgi:flagellar motor protein MotB